MAMPKVLDWLDDLVAKVATNTTNIANNKKTIEENKKLFDTHVADDNRHWTTADRQNFDRVVHFKGYFTTIDKLKTAYPTGQLGDYAIVGGTDTVWLWDDETNSWLNSTEQGIVISVNGRTGEVILTKTDVGLSNVDNTSDKNKPISTAQQTALNAKADRKKITLAQAESLTLRSGIYYIQNESKTILGFTDTYWTVIVGENETGAKSASQIWINATSSTDQHMYVRKQQNGTSWSEFKEILTDAHFTELNTKIETNITDIGNLQINKANRGKVTLAQVNAINGLKSGIYTLQEQVTILGATYSVASVIVADWVDRDSILGAVQIFIPFNTGARNEIYWRHQNSGSDGTRTWGNFSRVANSDQITNLQSQITTNKNNITTNIDSINRLKDNRVERWKITKAQADGFDLRAGIYNVEGSGINILGYGQDHWNVIVGEGTIPPKSVTQIWIPFTYTDSIPRAFMRRRTTTGWSDFIEIITSNHITTADLNRFKQYKGYFALLSDLKTAFATATDGDYAIVGSALYIWNSKSNSWTEVSGSGGSTGTNKWSIKQYSVPEYTKQTIPQFKDIVGKTLDRQWEVEDTDSYLLNEAKNNYKCYLFETYVNMEEALEYSTTTMHHDDGINVFVNNKSIYSSAIVGNSDTISIPVVTGWNKIQVLLCEVGGEEIFRLGIKFTSSTKCLGMDCYHAETEPVGGYVPLVGNSTIEGTLTTTGNIVVGRDANVNGNITSTGTITSGSDLTVKGKITSTGDIVSGGIVGITSNAYLKYNTDEKSISFIFN